MEIITFIQENMEKRSYNTLDFVVMPIVMVIFVLVLYLIDSPNNNWGEVKDYINGTEKIEACSLNNGNCYELEADISNGQIKKIYFPNGSYLYFSADINKKGNASDFDQNGNRWDFTVDMDSPIINNAINDWADDKETDRDMGLLD